MMRVSLPGIVRNFCLALFVNILFWELFLRCFVSSPCTQQFDYQLGYTNLPEASFVYSSEGHSRGRFNSLGFNDNEPIKKERIRHIFILGDSYTESFQVARNHSYTQILEDQLNHVRGEEAIDVIKLARDGLTPAHYPLLLKRAAGFSPDLILLQFWAHSGGDLYDDNIICQYTKSGKIKAIYSRPKIEDKGKDKVRFIINHSALAYYALRRFKPWIMKVLYRLSNFRKNNHNQEAKNNTLRSTEDMKDRISFIIRKVQAVSKEIVVFYIPEPGIFFRNKSNRDPQTLQALRRASRETGVMFVDLTDNFKEHYKRDLQPLNGFLNTLPGTGHLNSLGHKVVAQALYEVVNDSFLNKSFSGPGNK